MNNPKISIILPVYNLAHCASVAIESVLRQSFKDFELIIVDDGSSDSIDGVVNSFKDKRIVYSKNKKNEGLIFSLNNGISIARGDFIARIDGDDKWIDEKKLEKQINFLINNTDYSLVGTHAIVCDKHGNNLYNITHPIDFKNIKRKMLLKNCFVHSSVLFSKKVAKEFGGYDRNEKYVEDYGLWLRMGEGYKLHNIPDFCVEYLLNENGETQGNNLRQIKANIKLIKKHKKKYHNYCLALIRWYLKFVVVYFGGLSLINDFKKYKKN